MRLKLLTKLILFILFPALLGLCVVAGFSSYAAKEALDRQIIEELTLVSEGQRSEFNNITMLLTDTLRTNAQQPRLVNLVSAAAEGKATAAQNEQAQQVVESVQKNLRLVRSVGVLGPDGTTLVHTTKQQIGSNRIDRNYFKKPMQGQVTAENRISQNTNEITSLIAVPVLVDGKPAGVLFADIDLPELAKSTTDSIKIGRTGLAFMLSGTGSCITHPDKSNIGKDLSNLPWVKQVTTQRNGRVAYDWEGRSKVAYFREVANMDWIVAITAEEADLLSVINDMIRNNIILVSISVLVVGMIIFLVARGIASALGKGMRFAGFVAEGNLTIPPDMQQDMDAATRRTDEIGQLLGSVSHMVNNIRTLFAEAKEKTDEAERATEEARKAMAEADDARRQAENARRDGMLAAAERLESVVNIVSSASTELAAQIEQSEHGSTEQAARITETATAMEQMNSTVLEVARNAGTASEVSTATRQKADAGAEVVKQSLNAIQQVQVKSVALKADMVTLSGHAQSISQIMGVISDIADQTNLLALNAAIEAARAGEAGRGFAVVADEVRKLAEKTMASTADVGNAIRAIQQSAEQSSRQVDEAVQVIEEATVFAGQSGEALAEIVRMADNTADQVQAIATASEQQSASSNEINSSITQVNSIASDTARAMSEAARAVSELANQTQVLSGLIDDMKRG